MRARGQLMLTLNVKESLAAIDRANKAMVGMKLHLLRTGIIIIINCELRFVQLWRINHTYINSQFIIVSSHKALY